MNKVTLDHFERAVADIADHGDNDTLPFDIDTRFISDNEAALAQLAFEHFQYLDSVGVKDTIEAINSLQLFSERLLAPTGPTGFRITTKIHPFWNIYFNGLGVAIAEAHEPRRSPRAHSYRFTSNGPALFDRDASWRAYLKACIEDDALQADGAIVVKTDISSFYEHVYHHRLENCVADFFPKDSSTLSVQVDRLLNHLASGRSFGLPVGGQCARILAELLMSSIDQRLSDAQIAWHRYVDDFTLITTSQANAYRALSELSHALADYGLSLNRTKTTILTAKHYTDYVALQLGDPDDEAHKLRQIDLHFDPYSDTAHSDFEQLKQTVSQLEVQGLLKSELQKSQPDAFLVSQIGRTLKLHPPKIALQLCATLLDQKNLHAFRGSWSTIMRGIASVRSENGNSDIFEPLDILIDDVSDHSPHLLIPETNCLFYLKILRFRRTERRARFVANVFASSQSETVKRGCIECWQEWKDRPNFNKLRNMWNALGAEEQRMLWYAASTFGDEGKHFRKQARASLPNRWRLGIEHTGTATFESLYRQWA